MFSYLDSKFLPRFIIQKSVNLYPPLFHLVKKIDSIVSTNNNELSN